MTGSAQQIFCTGSAPESLGGGVHINKLTVVMHRYRFRRKLHQAAIALFTLLQRLFNEFLFGDVAHHSANLDRLLLLVSLNRYHTFEMPPDAFHVFYAIGRTQRQI